MAVLVEKENSAVLLGVGWPRRPLWGLTPKKTNSAFGWSFQKNERGFAEDNWKVSLKPRAF